MNEASVDKKEVEEILIKEFIEKILHHTFSKIVPSERPDFYLHLNGKTERVAIELTDYFNDTISGTTSPLTPVSEFWDKVQTSLCQQIINLKHLSDITDFRIRLNYNSEIRGNNNTLVVQFSKELVDFLEKHPFCGFQRFPSVNARSCIPIFSGFPILESLVSYMLIWRKNKGEDYPYPNCWICDNLNTGCIGLDLKNIKSDIQKKNIKAATYDWEPTDEKWLLIAAPGNILSNKAGPSDQQVNWKDPELEELCRDSLFDRIFFWERIRGWYISLKPNYPIVKINA